MNTILLETPFKLGDVVEPILNETEDDNNFYYIVVNFMIYNADENGFVNSYSVGCSDKAGATFYFKPFELKAVEKVNQ